LLLELVGFVVVLLLLFPVGMITPTSSQKPFLQ
jgi:hypothetical protein